MEKYLFNFKQYLNQPAATAVAVVYEAFHKADKDVDFTSF